MATCPLCVNHPEPRITSERGSRTGLAIGFSLSPNALDAVEFTAKGLPGDARPAMAWTVSLLRQLPPFLICTCGDSPENPFGTVSTDGPARVYWAARLVHSVSGLVPRRLLLRGRCGSLLSRPDGGMSKRLRPNGLVAGSGALGLLRYDGLLDLEVGGVGQWQSWLETWPLR